MERKNTILLTVIAVATLLVAVVGATFAYFTATSTSGGSGDTATATTANLSSITLNTAAAGSSSYVEYPGGYLVVGMSVEGSGADTTATYAINGSIINGTETTLNWTLYEVSSQVTGDLITSCDPTNEYGSVSGRYSYIGCQVSEAITTGEEVESGNVAAYETLNLSTEVTGETLSITSTGIARTYYYLVVEYPEMDDEQDDDQGTTITARLTGLTNVDFSS